MTTPPVQDVLELRLPADPALALTARMFAGALAYHLDRSNSEDLKLAFSELLAAAVDARTDVVEFRADIGRAEVHVRGTGRLDGDGDGDELQEHEKFVRKHRADLLAALFPGLRTVDGSLVLPLDGTA